MTFPDLNTAKTTATQLGLLLIREDVRPAGDTSPSWGPHDHLQAASPMSPSDFSARLLAYCYRFRGSAVDWGRTDVHNTAVGGVPLSLHQVFLAGDVVYD